MTFKHALVLVVAALAVPLLACSAGGGPGAPRACFLAGECVELDECAGDMDGDAVDDQLVIGREFAQTLHEMIVCGNISIVFSLGVIDAVLSLAGEAATGDATPAVTFVDGTYTTTPAGFAQTSMQLQLREAAGDQAGDVVTANALDPASYLVDTSATRDDAAGTVTIDFGSPGPLAALLGFGDVPTNPIVVQQSDVQAMADGVRALFLDTAFTVVVESGETAFTYDIDSPPLTVGALVDGAPLELAVTGLQGERASTMQSIETTTWDIEYVAKPAPIIEGTIEFSVAGGALAYDGRATFLPSLVPTMEYFCPVAAGQ